MGLASHKLVTASILAAGGLILLWPKAFPAETEALRAFSRSMRAFALAGITYAALLACGAGTPFLCVSPKMHSALPKVKFIVGGVALGIMVSIIVSGSFWHYVKFMRARHDPKTRPNLSDNLEK